MLRYRYEALSTNSSLTRGTTYGGFVIPCLEPVLMIMAGFSWGIIVGRNACWTFTMLPHTSVNKALNRHICQDVPEDVNLEDLVPVVETVPGCAPETDPGIVHENGNLEHTDV